MLYRIAVESAPRGCTEDEGRPLEAGLQEQASNHLKLLWSKARVVSVKEKSRLRLWQVRIREMNERTTDEASKARGRRQNWRPFYLPG